MVKAAVLGAAGGIGQPLSLLLKVSPLIDELALYDVVNSPGVAVDLSHISSPAKVTGYLPNDDGLKKTLEGCNIVVIPAGIPRKPDMTRDDLFKINAGIVRDLVTGVAKYCPKAFVLVISNPVNSTVPIAAEILKAHGVFDAKRLFGVTTLDVVRASTFTAEITGESDSRKLYVPVVGGHSGDTIVPLFSQAKPSVSIPADKIDGLVNRIQFGGDEVVKAKNGGGSATLSMAYAGFRFAEYFILPAYPRTQADRVHAVKGESVTEPAFVYLPGVPGGAEVQKAAGGLEFFAVPVELGAEGVVKVANPLTAATEPEKKLLETAIKGLQGNISKGVEFAKASEAKL